MSIRSFHWIKFCSFTLNQSNENQALTNWTDPVDRACCTEISKTHTFANTLGYPDVYAIIQLTTKWGSLYVSVCLVKTKIEWSMCGINQSFCSADNAHERIGKSQICRQNFNFSNIMVLKTISRFPMCFNREIRKLFPFTLFFFVPLFPRFFHKFFHVIVELYSVYRDFIFHMPPYHSLRIKRGDGWHKRVRV